jgi:hypothetical protein
LSIAKERGEMEQLFAIPGDGPGAYALGLLGGAEQLNQGEESGFHTLPP